MRKVFTFIGDIKCSGWTRPFWFTINATGYKLKGEHYRLLMARIKPGDIVIRRFEGYIDKWLIPGWWNHGGVYVGGDAKQVVHAVSDGVLIEDVLNFMRTDHMIVLRPPEDMREEGIKRAMQIVGSEYDFAFDFGDNKRFSCTEVVDHCYPGIIEPRKRFWRKTIVADDIVAMARLTSSKLEVVWDSTQDVAPSSTRKLVKKQA